MIWTGNAPGSRGHKLPEDAEILNVAERTTMGKTGPGDNRWNIRSEKAIGRRRVVQQERGTVKGQANVPFAKNRDDGQSWPRNVDQLQTPWHSPKRPGSGKSATSVNNSPSSRPQRTRSHRGRGREKKVKNTHGGRGE